MLPFLFVAPEARIAWQSHHVVHAGEEIRSLDPWAELFPLEREIPRNQVRAVEVADVGGPEVRNALDVELVIVPDAAARRVLARLPAGGAALCVALADDVAWDVVFGEPMSSRPRSSKSGPTGCRSLACVRVSLSRSAARRRDVSHPRLAHRRAREAVPRAVVGRPRCALLIAECAARQGIAGFVPHRAGVALRHSSRRRSGSCVGWWDDRAAIAIASPAGVPGHQPAWREAPVGWESGRHGRALLSDDDEVEITRGDIVMFEKHVETVNA